MNRNLNIAVCGAGPAGLAAALFLKREGHGVEIFERFETPSPVGSGLILQPTGLSVLANLGLVERILQHGHRIDRLLGSDSRSGRKVLDVAYADGPGGRFGLAVQRAALFDLLNDAAKREQIAVRAGAEVHGVRESAAGQTLETSAGRFGPFDLIVDASGTRSRLVSSLFPTELASPLSYGAYWATLDAGTFNFRRHTLEQRYRHASVMIGALPVGSRDDMKDEKIAFFWSQKVSALDNLRQKGLGRWKSTVLSHWPGLDPLLEQITCWEDMVFAHYSHRTLRVPRSGRVVFIGDAAHCTSPQLGQGANMALLDAAALAAGLSRCVDLDSALDFYCRARRSHVRLFQFLSRALTPFYQGDSRIVSGVRDQLVSLVAPVPPFPRILAAIVSGMLGRPLAQVGTVEADWHQFFQAAE